MIEIRAAEKCQNWEQMPQSAPVGNKKKVATRLLWLRLCLSVGVSACRAQDECTPSSQQQSKTFQTERKILFVMFDGIVWSLHMILTYVCGKLGSYNSSWSEWMNNGGMAWIWWIIHHHCIRLACQSTLNFFVAMAHLEARPTWLPFCSLSLSLSLSL